MTDSKGSDTAAQPPDNGGSADNDLTGAAEPDQPSRVAKPTGEAKPKETGWASRPLWIKTSIFAVAGWVVIYGATSLLMWSVAPATWDEGRLRAIGLLLAAMIAVPGGYIAFRRQVELERSNTRDQERLEYERERESKRQEERSEDQRREVRRDLGDRFVTATKLLGDEKAAVRLAGVTALAGVADDWGELKDQEQQQACIDILCDYLRQPLPMIDEDGDGVAPRKNSQSQPAQDVEQAPGSAPESLIPAPEEVQVRSAITRTIAKHLRGPHLPGRRKAASGRWSALNFDFSSVTFAWPLDMSSTVFSGDAQWRGATFNSSVDWGYATFRARVTWSDATFRASVTWSDANFDSNADWRDANFDGDADWRDANFDGDADWRDANFDGDADWCGAIFEGQASWPSARFATGRPSFRDKRTGKTASFGYAPDFSGIQIDDDNDFLAEILAMVNQPQETSRRRRPGARITT